MAKLVRENFCDGFGDCLPNCPTGAITFENREAPEYDEAAVEAAKKAKERSNQKEVEVMTEREAQVRAEMEQHATHACAHERAGESSGGAFACRCPGSRFMQFDRNEADEAVFKGQYSPYRICITILNIVFTVLMLAQPLFGIAMSRHLYSLPLFTGMSGTARQIHMVLA